MNVAVHDLRNPIAVVRASAQMAMRQIDRGALDAARGRLDVIVQQADRVSTMLETFLDAAYIESGQVPLRKERGDLAEMVRMASATVGQTLSELGTRTFDLDLIDDCVGDWDRGKVQRALGALIENAYLFGVSDAPVRVEMRRLGSNVLIRVSGGGAGPAAEERSKLFEPFFRGHMASEVGHAGSGLGLFTARGIARAHGGDVREAREGPPDAFEIELPLSMEQPGQLK